MTPTDFQLEQHYDHIGKRPQRKFEETLTHFNRDVFWYDRDEVSRQAENALRSGTMKVTYENHRKVVEIAVNIMRRETVHDIALTILTHRYFAEYRKNAFAGIGSFNVDYAFLVKRVGMVFNATTGRINTSTIPSMLKEYTKPTLVQVNHIAGIVKEVNVPDTGETLNEWAIKFNAGAPESTTYRVAGLKVGA